MTRLMIPAIAAALAGAPVVAQDAAAPAAAAPAATAAPAASAPAVTAGKLTAKLTGDKVPGDEGDPDGTATASLDIAGGKLCYEVAYRKLAPVTAAHIHAGGSGKAGDPVVTLKLDPDEYIKGCTPVTPEVAAALLADPGAYYVNVHTTELPKGAIRGQLDK